MNAPASMLGVAAMALLLAWALAAFAAWSGERESALRRLRASASTGAMDPVMDPSYNMVQVAKQSVLLEEHLNEPRKRCADCIKKHFLHIVGLAEEAVSLEAARRRAHVEYMRSVAEGYDSLFARWRSGADPKAVADGARALRKDVMKRYL